MPRIGEMVQSKFLKQDDVPDPTVVTVQGVKQVNVAKEGAEPEMKWAIKFSEFAQPMVLNSTNIHLAAQITGSDDTDDWKGKELVLYADPNVSFGGKLVGGLRFRGHEKAPVKKLAVAGSGNAVADMDDDIPW